MAVTKLVGDILPDFLKVVDLGERFLGLGSHTPKHKKQVLRQKKKLLVPVAKRIIRRILSTPGIRVDNPALAKLNGLGKRKRKSTPKAGVKRRRKLTAKRKSDSETMPGRGKRRRTGGSHTVAHMLHGGTGDLKPQFMTISTNLASAPDKYTQVKVALPISHFGTQQARTTVFEILRIDWYLNITDLDGGLNTDVGFLSTTSIRSTDLACTRDTITEDVANSLVVAPALSHAKINTSGVVHKTQPIVVDTSDAAGNGILVATDVLYITHGNVEGTQAGRVTAKILYRLSAVGITEYVGILQAQQ